MERKNQHILGEMDVKKALIKLSIPATIGMIVNALYNLVDAWFVGMGVGEIAIGGLTLAFPIQMIVIAFALMIGIGGASVFSRAYGRKDTDTMDLTVNTALRMGIIIAVFVAIIGSIFLDDLLYFIGATTTNIVYGRDYLQIILIGITFQTVSMILNNFTRAEGRAKIAMKAMVLGTGLNIILDPFFIFTSLNVFGLTVPLLGLGVQGAALATIISQFIAFVYIYRRAFDQASVLKIRMNIRNFFDVHIENAKEILQIGSPTFFRNAIGAILSIIVLRTISQYAGVFTEEYTSIYGIVNRVIFFVFMPAFGLVQGLAPIAGYNFGANQYERLVEVIKFASKILLVYFVFGFILIQVGAPFIFDAFSVNDNQFIITTGAAVFRTITLGLVFISYQIIIGAVYQAFGKAKLALIVSVMRQFIIFIPVWIILTNLFALSGLWYTFVVADVLSGIISYLMYLHEINRLKQLQ